ncbi:cohesin domain-containing protein [Natrinema sp. 1APR25-10V2]|uniref:cohesin domain-containing protein n=1 Tax=Natrinema sp. 1APR25-10V2 TaxID=2951081 RepID=UPI0028747B52|nr:cohesin domain-containing protein [Natrinema sp. 1APR25-10V2]MDS0473896.1 cohesin domain-containing protein [Natrinema sp. 1APR25-10V2]
MPSTDRIGTVGTVVAVLFVLSGTAIAGPAVAIDQVAILSADRAQVAAAPGETIEIDVTLQSSGGHGGEGVSAVTLIAQYNPEYVEITDIQRGPWLEGDGTEVRTVEAIAHERGTAVIEQRRVPAAGGTTGNGTIATLTVRVAEDAPAGTTAISFAESDVELTGDWPMAVVDESATVAIDGGDEPLDPFDHPDPDELDLALEPNASSPGNDSDGSDGETADSGGDAPVPGFTAEAALAAVAFTAGALWIGRDDRRR